EVKIQQIGRGHSKGDTIVYLPGQKICFSGDLVEYEAACYTGDAYLADWPQTLDRLCAMKFEKLVPGRGPTLIGAEKVQQGLAYTRDFTSTLYRSAQEAVAQGMDLKAAMAHTRKAMDPKFGHVFIYEHCLPFDVTRAYDEASGIRDPRIWTAERDQQMWHALQAG
ncbi:MAG: MBL fold metallo-hydrolase, partial [Burkholderiales bacterium]|nr:MBL fold metallo-hydrolase [Burkholderiales bacterium]